MNEYKRIKQLGIPIITDDRSGIRGVRFEEVDAAVVKQFGKGADQKFSDWFGVQTCPIINGEGMGYPWDVEAVLERLFTGRLTGTQAWMD